MNTLLLRCLRMVIKDSACPGINQTNRSPYGFWYPKWWGFLGGSGKEFTCQCRRLRRYKFDPWVGKIPWRRKWQSTQYSCLGNPIDRGPRKATVHAGHKRVRPDLAPKQQLQMIKSCLLCIYLDSTKILSLIFFHVLLFEYNFVKISAWELLLFRLEQTNTNVLSLVNCHC